MRAFDLGPERERGRVRFSFPDRGEDPETTCSVVMHLVEDADQGIEEPIMILFIEPISKNTGMYVPAYPLPLLEIGS